jgi:hypothetical protein
MKTPDDLDRQLDEWLQQEGPTLPPEAPLEHAIQHARSHPRRRDPFGFLRRDPMAGRTTTLALQPAFMLVVLGLLIAVAGAVVVGSQLDNTPVVVPPPTTSPASPVPSAGPSSSPTTGPSVHIALKDDVGSGATVDIVDLSGTLVGARAAELNERAPDPAAPTSGDVTVQNVDPTTLWIAWTSGNCPDAHTLTIDPTGRSISISQPPFCGGDTIGVGRQLVLTFNRPTAAADVTATLVRLDAASATP